MRRLFSTFARGLPGLGLLVMRIAAAAALVVLAFTALRQHQGIEAVAFNVTMIVGGLLLVAGLWTPVVGSLVAILALWNASARTGDLWANLLLAALGAALALLGPGAYSMDARLFGWKRIDVPERRRESREQEPGL